MARLERGRYISARDWDDFLSTAGDSTRIWLTFGEGKDAFSFQTNANASDSLAIAENLLNLGTRGPASIHHMYEGFHISHKIREGVE